MHKNKDGLLKELWLCVFMCECVYVYICVLVFVKNKSSQHRFMNVLHVNISMCAWHVHVVMSYRTNLKRMRLKSRAVFYLQLVFNSAIGYNRNIQLNSVPAETDGKHWVNLQGFFLISILTQNCNVVFENYKITFFYHYIVDTYIQFTIYLYMFS